MSIGETMAKLFAENGARIVLLCRDSARAEAARSQMGYQGQTMAIACDVRHREEIGHATGLSLHHFSASMPRSTTPARGILSSLEGVAMDDVRDAFEINCSARSKE
jgi:NADP-dependent 3-hydroxy acid dehydrogenase YdfG